MVKDFIKKIRKGINLIINSELVIILIGLLLFCKMILFYKNTIYSFDVFQNEIAVKTFIFSMFIVTFLFLFKNRSRFVIGTLINLLLSILMFGDELYYGYSTSFLSVSQLSNVQYSEQIAVALKELLHIYQVLYFVDIIIILLLLITRFVKIEKIKKRAYKPAIVYISIMIIVYATTISSYISAAEEKKYNKKMQVENGTLYAVHYIDVKSNINLRKTAKYTSKDDMMVAYDKLKNVYDEKYKGDIYGFDGVAKDKNVIMLQLESYQSFLIDKKINGKEITPNINKFLKENINIKNMMIQSYSTTADSEHSSITSMYPLENGMAFAQYSGNSYDDIFKEYKNAGYYTMYLNGNDENFWNRKNVYRLMDIDELDFIDDYDENSLLINKWISDEDLYKQSVQKMKKAEEENGKFFASILSASCHNAFDLPGLEDREGRVDVEVGEEYDDTFFGHYLEAANYADYSFGIFIDELKKNDLYDNTVIFIFGDHYGMQMYNNEMLDFIKKEDHELSNVETEINYINVVCGIRIPGIDEHMEIDKTISKLDIKPTLTALSGIEDGISLGTSMWGTKDFACLNNGVIVTDNYYYNGDWYDRQNNEKINLDSISEEEKELFDYYTKCMDEEITISNSIVLNNLLK